VKEEYSACSHGYTPWFFCSHFTVFYLHSAHSTDEVLGFIALKKKRRVSAGTSEPKRDTTAKQFPFYGGEEL
jgi:hypothetical protein